MSEEQVRRGEAAKILCEGVFKDAFAAAKAGVINQMIAGNKTPEELALLQCKIEAYGEISGVIEGFIVDGQRAQDEIKSLEDSLNG